MRKFTPGEITSLEIAAESSFKDTCTIDRVVTSGNSYGEIEETWVTTSGIPCGIEITGGIEQSRGQVIVTNRDAIIRLPIDTEIDIRDRITVTQKNGVTISGIQFEIISLPKFGTANMRLDLRRIEI